MGLSSRLTRLSVLLPRPFDAAFTYETESALPPGTLVRVPLGPREVVGVVWDEPPDDMRPAKSVVAILEVPPLPVALMAFIDWVAAYTLARRGDVLALAVKESLLAARVRRGKKIDFSGADASFAPPDLSAAQAHAATMLVDAVRRHAFSVTLLDGVTGSGKTEVYLEAVAQALRERRQAVVLLPEIALSVQLIDRFTRRFGVAPAVWHSELTPALRRETFRAVAKGDVDVVVGARSALFLPFPDLGLVVVDEEHEAAFKQEDGVIYHARDMAVVRARLSGAACVLASATPSLESVENAARGRYARLDLPARHGGALLPQIQAVDLRAHPPERGKFISPVVLGGVRAALARGEQAMLFLNRRGYAPLTLCRHCGHRMSCPNCTAWLVEHRTRARLICHHCDYGAALPPKCPACEAEQSFVPIGPGVERIAEEVAWVFPTARTLVMTSDAITGPKQAQAAAAAILAGDVDVIIGTQMVAKGWHFPKLTMVGVVDADLGLGGGDLRAGERTVQLLHQVAGRAGRAAVPGQVMVQSYVPEHPVIAAVLSGNLPEFLVQEAAQRQPGHWPPYGRLVALIVSAADERQADAVARALSRSAPYIKGVDILGPAPAPFALLRGRFRKRLLLKADRQVAVQEITRAWLARTDIPRMVRVDVDVDPVSFM
ncbi:MAG: primosomal protein N' [Acidocella sp.]|nr:primosomal protein N' [Acidocella sp.]